MCMEKLLSERRANLPVPFPVKLGDMLYGFNFL
jgi:hypothetical protein